MSDLTPTDMRDAVPVTLEDEMRKSYLDYAMSVIVSRALPDVRDGMKPVHRRILFSMKENGYTHDKPYRKSARAVGDVIGKYHPHGDQAVYDALVRMAQDFSLRLPLIDGQGNFGSLDGDPPAAMRYTEIKLTKVAAHLLDDLDKDTVDFRPNYDNQELEPVVLPAKFPNLLVNGAGGIAVGMATNIPPHNLGEVTSACIALLENPDIEIAELCGYVPGPDFPTGGVILGRGGAFTAYHTGRGSVIIRGKAEIEARDKDRSSIVVTEIPYQVNKSVLVEKIAELAREKKIEGVTDLRDESDRNGVRIVVDLKKDASPEVVLNRLYRYTPLQTSFGVNMLAIDKGRPERMDLKRCLSAFLDFREEATARRVRFELNKARDRAHVLVGLAAATANLDEVVKLIKESPDPATAKRLLTERSWQAGDMAPYIRLIDDPRHPIAEDGTYRLSERQAQAILDLRLHRLTALGRDELGNELKELADAVADYLDILASRTRILDIIKGELLEIKEKFATPRKTEIIEGDDDTDDESLIPNESAAVLFSANGYVMRAPTAAYQAQKRGGRGRNGMNTRDEDALSRVLIANTHDNLLVFTDKGTVYKIKVWKLPVGTSQSRGKALINLLPLQSGETVTAVTIVSKENEAREDMFVMFATASGNIRRNPLSDFLNVRANGKIAMKLDEGDKLIGAKLCVESDDILLVTHNGRGLKFNATESRVFAGRGSTGIRGVRLLEGDELIALNVIAGSDMTAAEMRAYLKASNEARRANAENSETEIEAEEADDEESNGDDITLTPERFAELAALEATILIVSDKGYGKRFSSHAVRKTARGGQGVNVINLGRRGGGVVAAFPVTEKDDIIAVTDGGKIIRFSADSVSLQSRSASGVTLVNVENEEKTVSVAVIPDTGEDPSEETDGAVNDMSTDADKDA